MNKKIPFFFILSVILLGLVCCFNCNYVNAQGSYEWIQNGGFEDIGGDQFGGSGGFESGQLGIMWDGSIAPCSVQSGGLLGSSYHAQLGYTGYLVGELETPVNVSFVTELSFWYSQGTGYTLRVSLGYNDSTSNVVDISPPSSGINYVDLTGYLESDKFFVRITFHSVSNIGWYIDNVVCILPSSGGGQSVVSQYTSPWWTAQDFDFQGINIAGIGHSGVACFYTGYGEESNQLIQNIPYLDSDTVTSITLWAETDYDLGDIDVKFTVIYSDRSWSSHTETIINGDTWSELVFSGFLLPNKIIIQIQISIINGGSFYNHIDDISLTSTIPYGQSKFSYYVTPTPISSNNISFSCYQRINYIFHGEVFNDSGVCIGDGTYIITSSTGIQTGNINDGVFSFTLTQRTNNLGIDIIGENINIQIDITDGESFIIVITANWIYVAGGGSGDLDDGGTIPYTTIGIGTFTSFIINAFLLFLLPLIFAFYCGKNGVNPMLGFVIAFSIIAVIGYTAGITNIVVLFVMVLVDIITGLILFERTRNGVG